MTPDAILRQEAHWLYQSVRAANPDNLLKTNEALMRVNQFEPRRIPEGQRSSRLQCPRCFVLYGVRASMTPIPSDSNDYDLTRCDTCGTEVVLTI